jgi:hypothetical protein
MMMRKKETFVVAALALLAASLCALPLPGDGADAPRMTKEELRSLLGNPDVVILDVRVGPEWQNSKEKIQGAVREDPDEVKTWAEKYPKSKTLVLYCS